MSDQTFLKWHDRVQAAQDLRNGNATCYTWHLLAAEAIGHYRPTSKQVHHFTRSANTVVTLNNNIIIKMEDAVNTTISEPLDIVKLALGE